MKCQHCEDPKIVFSLMDVMPKIGWASHCLVEKDGKIGLYHYECGRADIVGFYKMFVEMSESLDK